MPTTTNKQTGLPGDSQSTQATTSGPTSINMAPNQTANSKLAVRNTGFKTRALDPEWDLATLLYIENEAAVDVVGGTFKRSGKVQAATRALVLDAASLNLVRCAGYNMRFNVDAAKAVAKAVAKTADVMKCLTVVKPGKDRKIIFGIHASTVAEDNSKGRNAKANRDAVHVWPLPVVFIEALASIDLPDDDEHFNLLSQLKGIKLETYFEDRKKSLTFSDESMLTNIELDTAYNKISDANKTEGVPPVAKAVSGKRKLASLEEKCKDLEETAGFIASVLELGNDAVAISINLTDFQVVTDPNGRMLVTGKRIKREEEVLDAEDDNEEEDEEEEL
jgi:hypothetical protein